MNVRMVAAACLSGAVTAVAFPSLNIWIAAWVSLVPLFWAIEGKTVREAAILGWIGGTVHYGLLVYWLVGTVGRYGGLPLVVSIGAFLLLVIYLGAYWALFSAVTVHIRKVLGLGPLWVIPPVWCALEALRSVFFTGFPWALMGYSQWKVAPIVQVADITGVSGISFLVVWCNAVVFELLTIGLHGRSGRVLRTSVGFVLLGAMVGGALLYGQNRIREITGLSENAPKVTVGIAQGNTKQFLQWDADFQEKTVSIYEDQTRKLAESGAKLVVWPETSVPFFFGIEEEYTIRVFKLAHQTDTDILFGSPAVYIDKEGRKSLRNRAYLIGPEGRILGWYDKMHLVPFGEYVPLKSVLFFLHDLIANIGDFSPGDSPMPLKSTTGASVGVGVCFESIFPWVSRVLTNNGADLLANITNDGWFGDTSAPHQHLSMLTFRAVENRRWVVRAANSGISAVIDPCGRIVSRIPLDRRNVLVDKVARLQLQSYYTLHGDYPAYACSFFGGGLFILSLGLFYARRRHE